MNPPLMYHRLFLSGMFLTALCGPPLFPLCVHAEPFIGATRSQHGWELLDGQGAPWLQDAHTNVQLTEGATLRSSDSRYQVATETHGNQTTLRR